MNCFSSEIGHDYTTYSFAYSRFVQLTTDDRLSEVYTQGYLPFSGSPDVHGVGYMARSLRIRLEHWLPNSENRRIYRKFDSVERVILPVTELIDRSQMLNFCHAYFAERHGENIMPAARLTYILDSGWVTDVISYLYQGKIAAYVWLGRDGTATHFYYSFYDLTYAKQSLGLWLMTDLALESQARGNEHLYLGTAYGEKGLYKINFDGLEWWDGQEWCTDRQALKQLCRTDESRKLEAIDRWKESLNRF